MAEQSTGPVRRLWLPTLLLLLALCIVAGAIILRMTGTNLPRIFPTPVPGSPIPVQSEGTPAAEGGGSLEITLSEGQARPVAPERLPVATGVPLSNEQVEQILARLPGLVVEPQDLEVFRLPVESLPPPRPGETIQEAFPPPPPPIEPMPVESGPLQVLRYSPEGEIPLAPFISVTFSQPMVPLATLSDLSAMDVPVVVEPNLKGTWRWVGTKTLTFEVDSDEIDRLPKATEYRVTVPAGTTSAIGGVLSDPVAWTFTTPPPKLTTGYPTYGPQALDPVFFVEFDQRIDPEAVLATIKVTANGQVVEIALATDEDIKKDKTVASLAARSLEGRWLSFRAKEKLPADAEISVVIGPGTPSAEGPLVTKEPQAFSFRTYAPLRIEEYGCSYWTEPCPPLTPFFIHFNNPLDVVAFQESLLSIDPDIPGVTINPVGDTITIQGATKGSTTYRVIVSGEIRDVFGQTLGKNESLTFRVGTAEPFLSGPDQMIVTLDPAAQKPVFSVFTLNYTKLDVRVYAVQPSDLPAYWKYRNEFYNQVTPPEPPGRKVIDETMKLEAPADVMVQADVDLSRVMDGRFGHFIVVVQPTRPLLDLNPNQYWPVVQAWVQVTKIGLDAFVDHTEMVAWATALEDGSPLEGVSVNAMPGAQQYVTEKDGIARFRLPSSGISYLVASKGSDTAILTGSPYYGGEITWAPRSVDDEMRWYVFDDRQMYRPGEEVHIKGWLRRVGSKQDGDVGLVGNAVTSVAYQVNDPQGNVLQNGEADVNSLGGFDLAFTIPANANLGYASVNFYAQPGAAELGGQSYSHNFQIQEFRRPEFEVTARNETTGPYFVGDYAIVATEAKYYAGGPLPNAEVQWQVSSSTTTYHPPNWPDFIFGTWVPWWYYEPMYIEGEFGTGFGGGEVQNYTGTTDASGNHYLRLDFGGSSLPSPHSILAQATVFDVNRQAWAATTSLMVHPASLYVGMRSDRTFVVRGTPLKIDLIVTDLDGNPVADRPIQVKAARLEWKVRGGNWAEEEVDVQTCNVGSMPEPVSCSFKTEIGGTYQITASIIDEMGRKNQSRMTRWVSGGQRPPSRKVEQEAVTLIPDQETYQPGEEASILVQSPFSPAEGLLTVSRSGILYTERFRMEEETTTLRIPIEEKHIPNLNVQVDLVGAAPRTDARGEAIKGIPPRPAFATGQINLSIPPIQRTLSLQIVPRDKELEPGGSTTLDLLLTDARGEPVPGAELAVVVVDEAILALTNYQLADPVAVFYQQRPSDLSSYYGRSSIVLVDPLSLAKAAQAEGQMRMAAAPAPTQMAMEAPAAPAMADMGGAGGGVGPAPIRLRIDFNPLAAFAPEVRTDSNGTASVEIKVPDNLTRYRVMVVAVDSGKQFGSGEANIVARLPLMVRPSAPRFLNFGDQFELPVVLQNQTDNPLEVDVAVRGGNIELTGDTGNRITVPARDRLEVRFPARTFMAGTARFQIAAVSGSYADAAAVELPVYTPATTEAFAVYGVVDEGSVAQPVAAPSGVFPQFGGLEIDTSSTALQALTDAVLYLVSYPYECTEQLASRILAVAALRDVLTAFSAEGLPSPQEMEAAVTRDIGRLQGLQNYDGGFPYWTRGRESIPFNTIHVAHALQRAKMKGFEVPETMQTSVLEYLRNIESYYPVWYDLHTRRTLSAYALFVRDLMGDGDADKARRLLDEAGLEELSLDAVGWIWAVLVDDPGSSTELEAIRRHVANRVVETAGAANFTTSYSEQDYLLLRSDRRTDAILLDALIADSPGSDLIPKIVNGLLAHKERGRWGSTQENVFVLLALDRYFNTFEAVTPDFVTRIWLGSTYAGSHEFAGRTTERRETNIPMTYLVDQTLGGGATQDLILDKEGAGRLYYRLGLQYAPTDLSLDPLEMGFVVQRRYEAVDDPEDVTRDEQGMWHIKAGARVRVHLTMVADNRRYHVALADPLPAGLEIINPALAVSGSVPQDPTSSQYRYGWWWWWTWYEHQNMRDQRAEAFTPLLWEGVYTYTYVARATTPGTFVVPPAKAEEMYSPEVFGRSASDWVIVE